MKEPEVCFLGKEIFKGVPEGHHTTSSRIIEAACRSGVNTKLISIESSGNARLENRASTFRMSESRPPALFRIVQKTCGLPDFYANEFISCSKAAIYAKRLQCDVIHYLNVTKEVASLAKRTFGVCIPCIAHLYHSAEAFNRLDFKLRLFSIRARLFDFIFATNKSLIQYFSDGLGIDSSRLYYVPTPIDTGKFNHLDSEQLRQKYGIPDDVSLIVYVGAIYPDRGIFVLLDAFKNLLKKTPEAMLLVFHPQLQGDEVRHFPLFEQIATKREFNSKVVVYGFSSKIEEAYSLADVVALPFTQPYWITDPPVVLLEAMACGAPIVTTRVGAIGEIANNTNAMFCKPNDVFSLTNALFWALKNKDKAQQLGLNARETARNQFAMELVGKQLQSIYEEIID